MKTGDRVCLLSQRGNSTTWLLSAPSMHRTTRGHASGPGLGSGTGALEEGNTDLLTLESNFLSGCPLGTGKTTLSYGSPYPCSVLPACLFVDDVGSRGYEVHLFCFLYWFYRNYKVINTQCEDIQITNSIDKYNERSRKTPPSFFPTTPTFCGFSQIPHSGDSGH